MAPEFMNNYELYNRTKPIDVYSFAMVLYEIITNQKPFKDCLNPNEIKEKVVNLKQRPAFDVPINQTCRYPYHTTDGQYCDIVFFNIFKLIGFVMKPEAPASLAASISESNT